MSDADTPLGVRLATGRDLDDVLGILAEGSAWALRKGVAQWPERFSRDVLQPTVERGELFVVDQSGLIDATITLLWRDPTFWGERDDAGFVHRLAIRRSARGLGARLIEWADGEASANWRCYLCVSSLSSNVRLRRYYEDLGFGYSGEVFGPLEHPHKAEHGSWSAALYERRVRDRFTRDAE